MARKYKFVGRNVARVDGIDKVTGKAKFTGDLIVPGMLYGKILRSPYPHARIAAIDTSSAESLPGVAGVLTGKDVLDLHQTARGVPVIAVKEACYQGEPVAAVAAVSEAVAAEAVSLIRVDYEALPAVIGIEAALKDGAPRVHDNLKDNICSHEHVEKGHVDAGFAEADEILENHFTFPMVYHYALEPHSVIADYKEQGITVWSSAQHPFSVQQDLANVFHVDPGKVRLIVSYLGGGFGSKSFTKIEPLVIALAHKAKRPVQICLSVSEAMLTVRRHAAKIRLKTGVKRDGTLVAREAEIYLDTGAYGSGASVGGRAAVRVLGPYRIPHVRSDARSVYTNTGSAGSFRSIGAPQTIFAGECQMDMIAEKLNMDPVELRRRNLLKNGEALHPKLRPLDVDLAVTLKRLQSASCWKTKARNKKAALGLACGISNAGGQPVSVSLLRLRADGSVAIMAGSTEMGQGARTVLAQIVAEELSLPLERIHVDGADTSVTPYDRSTGSSRSTTLMGRAVQQAARDLKKQMLQLAAAKLGVRPKQIRIEDGGLVTGEARLSFQEIVELRFGEAAGELIGRGYVGPEVVSKLPIVWEVGMGVAEVDMDAETGMLSVKSYTSAADVGKAIHPAQCAGQEEGASMMGLGHALFEEMIYDEGGQLVNSSMLSYRVPTFSDLPKSFHTILIENEDGPGPYGSRGMGEGGIFSIAPAVTNALARSTGVRIFDLPLTPERVWRAMKDR
jgi:CO/xanthine dehydrogenase Mo-binding subunit